MGIFDSRRYRDLDPAHRPHRPRDILRWGVLDRISGRRRVAAPGPPAPRAEAGAATTGRGSCLTWIGHSSFLVRLAGAPFLVDPVFSRRVGAFYPRHGDPGLQPRDLPEIRALLITHNHYDHLDRRSVAALDTRVPAVTPRGLGAWFRRWNRRPVHELRWWQSVEVGGLTVTLVPARHWTRRGIFDTNRTLWGGFVVERRGRAVYHAGDCAWFEGFADIGGRFAGLLAAMLPIGGYAPAWFMEKQHLNPEQAGRAFLALGARTLVPMHWGAFQLTDEPLVEPAARMRAWWRENDPRDGRRLRIPSVGETVLLEDSPP